MKCGHGPSSVVWSHMWLYPQRNACERVLFIGSSHMMMMKCNKSTVVRFRSAMVTSFCVRPTVEKWFWEYSKWPWNMIHLMPCRNPCRLYIHLASTYSVGPWSAVWSELRPTPPFPPVRFSWSAMVMGPESRVWSGLKLNMNYLPLLFTIFFLPCHFFGAE